MRGFEVCYTIEQQRMKFRFLDTITADAGFVAYGKDARELLENSSIALFSLMCDVKQVRAKEKREIRLSRSNLGELLFDYLNELIFLKDKDAILLSSFDINVHKNSTYNLFVQAYGQKINSLRHNLLVDIKAVTKHIFRIEKEKGIYKATVVVDI